MTVALEKETWRVFKIFLFRNKYLGSWEPNISRKIFMIIHTEEIRLRFLSGFPDLNKKEKLKLSLDEIINPIAILEKKSHRKGCHPGRLTLNPDRYNRAWGENRCINDPMDGADAPPFMRAGFISTPWGKHRLLDVSEDIKNPYRSMLARDSRSELQWGLQDMYFLGGLPLEYWCNGDSMGMMVPQSPSHSNTYQWPRTVFREKLPPCRQEEEDMGHVGECRCGRTDCFSRMFYLPCERAWWTRCGEGEFLEIHERNPLTWHGNQDWIGDNRPSGPDTSNLLFGHNVYIKYIQKIEDFDEAFKYEAGRRGWQFDEYCSWLSQFSDTPQGVTLFGDI